MYSIKTDLDVTGGATVNKDLLVKGNAVFEKNVTVNGTVSFANATFTAIEAATANITSTLDVAGKASLNGGVDIKGNSVIGDAVVGSDTATVNSNASFNGTASFANDINQTAGSAVLKHTTVDQLEVTGTTQFDGNITAGVGTTAAFDTLTANEATITAISSETITGTGTANFKDVNISGILGGTFSLDDVNATSLNVSGASGLQGAVTFGANVTGINSTATFKDIKLGANSASSTYRLSFTYSASGQRPTVVLQNEIQSELMSPTNLNVLKSATFGDESLDTYGITGKGLNKLDYVSISGNAVQSPATPLLEVTKGLTKVTDFEVTGNATIPNIESTGTANFNDININGVLGGTFSLDDINATSLNVSGASGLNGAVTLGANITGINTTATFKDIKLGANAASSTDRLSFTYSGSGLRPTVVLQNEIQSELMSPTNLNVLKTATFGDESLSTYSIASKGLNKLDYVTISGNLTQDPSTPLLEVTKGLTKVTDLEVTGTATLPNIESTGTANFNNINVSGTLGGTFDLDDIQATSLNVSGATGLNGAVTLGANITGNNTTATVKAINLGQNVANADVKLGFAYSAPGQRPTVLLQNEIQSESMAPVTLTVQKTATFGDESLATYGITGKGLNKLDYVEILGNSTQSPATPRLKVNGKTILNDVDFTGVVTGLTVDVSGQDLTPNSVIAAGEIKSSSLESTGGATINANLLVGGTANVTGALNSGAITSTGNVKGVGGEFSGNVSGVDGTFTGNVSGVNGTFSGDVSGAAGAFSGNVTVTGQTVTVKDLVVTGTTTGVVADANVDGLDIAPNKVDVTTTLSVAGNSTLADVSAGAITATGNVSAAAISGSSLKVTGNIEGVAIAGSSMNLTGAATTGSLSTGTLTSPTINGNTTFTDNVTVTGTLTPGAIDLSTTDVSAQSISTTAGASIGGNLVVAGTVDLSAADVSVKSLTTPGIVTSTNATDANVLPVLNSNTATVGTANVTALNVSGASNVASLDATGAVSVGSTLDVTGASTLGSVITPLISNADGIQIANDTTISANLAVTGTLTPGAIDLATTDVSAKSITTTEGANIGGNLVVAGTVDLSAADVSVKSLSSAGIIQSTDLVNANVLPVLKSTTATINAVNATELSVEGPTNISSLRTSADAVIGTTLTVSGQATAVSLVTPTISNETGVEIASNTKVTGDLTVTGTVTPGAIDLATTDVSAKSITTTGGANIGGDLVVAGTFDLSASDVTANTLASVGNTTVGADLVLTTGNVTGSPAVSGNLSVAGTSTLTGAATVGNKLTVNTGGIQVVAGGVRVDTGSITAQGANISGTATLENASVTSNAAVGGTLGVTGAATLNGGLTSSALTVTGDSVVQKLTVKGEFIPEGGLDLSGADITANSLDVATTLKATGLSTLSGGVSTTDISGSGKITTVDAQTGTLTVTGNQPVGGTLGVTGKATTGSLDTGAVSATSGTFSSTLGVTGAATFADAVTVNGVFTPVGGLDLSTSDITANSLDVATTIKSTAGATIGGDSTIAGTLGVTGAVSAPSLTLSNASGTGLDVKGNAIVAGTLSTTGAVTLGNTLGVTGKATTGSLDTGAVSATSIVGTAGLTMAGNSSFTNDLTVSGTFTPAGGLDLTTSDIVANSLSTSSTIHSDTNGTFGGTLGVTSNATIGGTLGVTGAVSAPSLALSAASGDALTVTADAKVTGKVTSGSLETGTVKTGANLVVGVKVGDQPETVQIFPDTFIAGKLRVEGGINADIDVSGQTLEPYAIEASATLSAVGNISTDAAVIANSGTFGAVGSQNNNLTVNGNVVTTGNFTVGGVLYANVDQSNADVNVKSLTSTNLVKGGSMQSTGNLTVGGAATITGTLGSGAITSTGKVKGVDGEFSGNVSGVGGTFTGAVTVGTTLGVTGAATVGGTLGVTGKATLAEASVTNLTTSGTATIGSTLAVTGTSTLAAVNISGALTTTGSVTLGDAAADVITVNGTSTFNEKATFEKGIEVAGVFTTDEANFVTTSVTTKKYDVIPSQVTSSTVAPAGTWTPDGSTSVYFITLDQNTTLAPIAGLIGGGKAASIFMYAKQDATGNRVLTADPSYSIVDGEQNLAANSVTIYQAVYDGVSNVIDLFIAQRTS